LERGTLGYFNKNEKMKSKFLQGLIFIPLLICSFLACKPENEVLNVSPGKGLSFSADTVYFDTVFTDLKTVTIRVRVFNQNDKAVNIKSVYVNGVNGKFPYSFHINGRVGPNRVNNVLLEGKDSAYVLVTAKIDSKDQDLPFIVKDSLVFEIEGRAERQDVKLLAYGQDALYLRNTTIACDTFWTSIRPIVILDTVSVKPGCELTIDQGTKVYGYNNAFLIVRGKIIANGTCTDPVVFQGTRLENYYSDVPGQWGGILVMDGAKAELNNCIVKNAFRGIQVGEVGALKPGIQLNAFMILRNSYIQNIVDYGVLGIKGGILAINNQIADCGEAGFAGLQGGDYELWHNTFGLSGNNPYQRDGKYQVIFADNIPDASTSTVFGGVLNVKAINNLIYGTENEEIAFGEAKTNVPFDTTFFNNIIRSNQPQFFVNGIRNKDNIKTPANFRFVSPFKYLLAPDTIFPVFGTGLPLINPTSFFPEELIPLDVLLGYLSADLLCMPRPIGADKKPDVGAYNKYIKKPE
jgi:hypothetical protein